MLIEVIRGNYSHTFLVETDIAARGIDIDELSHVINPMIIGNEFKKLVYKI